MTVYGLWHGGPNYSHGDIPHDIEAFRGIGQAGRVLQEREDNGGWRHLPTYYIDRDNSGTLFPCVEHSSMQLYYSSDSHEPFARLTIGPNGGVVRENY